MYFVSGYTMSNGKVGGNLDLNAGTGNIIMKSATVDVTTTATVDVTTTTLTVNGNTAVTGTLDVANDFAVNTDKFKVIAASGDTSIAGTLAVAGGVEFDATLNVKGDFSVNTDKFTVNASTGNTAVAGTFDVTALTTLKNDLKMSKDDAALTHSSSDASGGLAITSTNGYVDVEDVRFTGNQIGVSGDVDLLTLADGYVKVTAKLEVTNDVLLSEDAAVITHTAATSTTAGLTISSSNSYVDVEDVRFTDNTIGTAADPDLLTLDNADLTVSGTMTVTDDVKLSEDLAKITHTSSNSAATTGLTISSNVGFVDVEEVRFTNKKIGTNGNDDLLTLASGELTITGNVNMTGNLKLASTKFTVAASSGNTYVDGELTVNRATTLQETLEVTGETTMLADLKMSKTAAALTHTATQSGSTTGLTIRSTVGFVDVEDVRFTDNTIGISSDSDLVTLESQSVKIDGKLEVTDDLVMSETNAALTHYANASGGLTIKSTNGFIDVEDIRFTGNVIGISGDADIITLTTQSVAISGKLDSSDDFSVATTMFTVDAQTGNTAVDGTLRVTDATTLLNTLTVSNATTLQNTLDVANTFRVATNKFVVDHSSGNTAVAGTLDVTGATTLASTLDIADLVTLQDNIVMMQSSSALTHSAASGGLAITSTNGYVDIEEARFTGKKIGINGDETLLTLAAGGVTVTGAMNVSDDVILTETAAVIKHTAATGATTGLKVSSDNGYVDIEDVRFTSKQIGLSTDADLITLEDDIVTIAGHLRTADDFAVANTKFTVDAQTGNTDIEGTLAVNGSATLRSTLHVAAVSTLQDDLLLSEDAAVIKHSVGAGSTTAGLSILSEHYHVDVESVRFTDNTIGIAADPDLLTLTNAALAVAGTLTVSDDVKLSEDAAVITHTAPTTATNAGLAISSTNFHVDVESVRFTSKQIGTTTDADLITLADNAVAVAGTLTVSDDVKLSEANAVIEHTSTDAAASLTIKSSSGYVDVESVRFTTDEIGIATDADLIKLTDQQVSVRGKLQTTDDILMSEATAALTHDAASGVGLAITSSNGYVDVESVRFTGLQMGLDGAADLITLSNANVKITGTLDTTGYIKVASTKFTVDATGNTYADGTLGVKGVSTLEDDLLLSEDAAVIKHSVGAGSTTAGLSILSEHYHVDVESVRFTDAKIGTTTDADLITLADGSVSITGTLDTTGYIKVASTKFTVDATGNTYADGTLTVMGAADMNTTLNVKLDATLQSDMIMTADSAALTHSGTTGLTIKSTNAYVDVESVRFTDNTIGIAADPDLLTLTNAALAVAGTLTVSDDVKLSEDAAVITHTAPTTATNAGLAISSTNFHVDVESVRFTSKQIGTTTDADLITLADNAVAVAGTLTVSDDVKLSEANAVIEHTSTDAAASLTIKSSSGYVDVESVRFTTDEIGIATDADLIKLTDQQVSVRGKLQTTDDILMSEATAALTHDAASGVGLAITSSNGYVDVESVRFTGLQMGLDGAADLITLSNANVKITGTLDTTGYIKVASTKFTVDATGNTYADGTLGVKGVSTLEDDLLLSEDAAVIKHSVGAGSTTAGLSILSEHYHVDVESVRFTDAKIGTTTDADLITLADGSVSITGTLDTTGYIKVASTKFTVDATGNTYADGTLTVMGAADMNTTLNVKLDATLQSDMIMTADSAALTHSGTTGLTIKSTNAYVDVESVRFTDNTIGIAADPDLLTLTNAALAVAGTLTVSDDVKLSEDAAVITHTAPTTATNAGLAISSTNFHVDVESVRFTSKQIGTTTDADLITLADNAVAVAGTLTVSDDVKLSEANAVIEHTSTDALRV